jgi:hypothetical protein
MEKLKAAWSKGKEWAGVARSNPARTMKLLSAVSGALLIIGGISGVINIFNPLGIVISIYNILFGLLIVATELKSWPIIGAFQKHVDVYFHLLSVPKGKGGFYLFIGLLTFCASDWGMASVCVMIVAIVGVLHLVGIPADSRTNSSMAGSDGTHHHQEAMEPMDAAASASISNFALKVMQDNPDMVKQGLNFVAANPGLVAGSSSAAPPAPERPPAYSTQDSV